MALVGAITTAVFALSMPVANAKDTVYSPMAKAELEALLKGNSLAGNGRVNKPAEPYDWIAYYSEKGRITMRLKPEWGGFVYKGRWWMTEKGEFCRFFENKQKKEGCWLMYREGDFVRFVPSSGVAVEGRAVMIPGNAVGEEAME